MNSALGITLLSVGAGELQAVAVALMHVQLFRVVDGSRLNATSYGA